MVISHLSQHPWRRLRWLILAPHPDDETLGAGALIAQASKDGRLAGVVYLTDGSGSHPRGEAGTGRLVAIRRREGGNAVFRLTGSRRHAPIHLAWQDAAPPPPDSMEFALTVARMGSLCRRRGVDALAVTALHEPHCDHAAAALLAYAVKASAKRPILVAEYLVWGDVPLRGTRRIIRTEAMPTGRRRRALNEHRSQLTSAFGKGFRLPAERRRMPARDNLFCRRR